MQYPVVPSLKQVRPLQQFGKAGAPPVMHWVPITSF